MQVLPRGHIFFQMLNAEKKKYIQNGNVSHCTASKLCPFVLYFMYFSHFGTRVVGRKLLKMNTVNVCVCPKTKSFIIY